MNEADLWTAMQKEIKRAVGRYTPAALFHERMADVGLVFIEAVRAGKPPLPAIDHYIWDQIRKWRSRRAYERQRPPGKPLAVETPYLTRLIECLTPDGEAVVGLALLLVGGRCRASEAKALLVAELSKVGWCVRRIADAFSEVQEALGEV